MDLFDRLRTHLSQAGARCIFLSLKNFEKIFPSPKKRQRDDLIETDSGFILMNNDQTHLVTFDHYGQT